MVLSNMRLKEAAEGIPPLRTNLTLAWLAVPLHARRHKIGEALFAHASAVGKEHNYDYLSICADSYNIPACKAYAKYTQQGPVYRDQKTLCFRKDLRTD